MALTLLVVIVREELVSFPDRGRPVEYAHTVTLLALLELEHPLRVHIALRWSKVSLRHCAFVLGTRRALAIASVCVGTLEPLFRLRLHAARSQSAPLLQRLAVPVSQALVARVFESDMIFIIVYAFPGCR